MKEQSWKVSEVLSDRKDIAIDLGLGNGILFLPIAHKERANLIAAAPDMFAIIDKFLKTGYYSTEVGNQAFELMKKINPSYATK